MIEYFNIASKEDILANWLNDNWAGWHSAKYVKAHAKNKNVLKDDKYLREVILSKFNITTERLSLDEIKENWHNSIWWQENLLNVINIFDKMYVKKGVKSRGGIYSSWLTRLVQYIVTKDGEKTVAQKKNLLWNEAGHSYIHTGVATADEAKPDFTDINGNEIELKVCENERSIVYYYFKKLAANFDYSIKHDFHGAHKALFLTKARPHKLYTVDLESPDKLELNIGENIELDTIQTKNGKILYEIDLPAVPKVLLFGLTPSWYKK